MEMAIERNLSSIRSNAPREVCRTNWKRSVAARAGRRETLKVAVCPGATLSSAMAAGRFWVSQKAVRNESYDEGASTVFKETLSLFCHEDVPVFFALTTAWIVVEGEGEVMESEAGVKEPA